MGKVWQVLVAYCLLFILQISALLAIQTADLLGPETCPSGSYCIETSQCTSTHFTTKSGHPFYCGPRHSIDSKVCCAETEAAWNPDALHHDLNMLDSNSSDLDPSGLNKRTTENDDEVDIISLPFANNQDEGDLPNFVLFDSDTDNVSNEQIDDTESLLEDAIEEELNLGQPLSSQSSVREIGLGDGDEINDDFGKILDNHLDNGHESNPNIQFNQGSFQERNQFDGTRPIMGEHPNMEFRMRQDYEEANRNRAFVCPCEKGEKGDAGPKGEPGEPGKIIYIPVFVNAASPGSPGPMPAMFSSPQQMNQHVPQHPNPTVMPFNVPVSVQSLPLPPTQPAGHTVSTVPQQQYHHPIPSSLTANQLQQPPVPPTLTVANPIPYAESLEARLTRNAYELKQNDQRFANRRY